MAETESNLPSVFIGSSSEGLDVAREIELHLQPFAITTIWKDGVFGLGSGTLESLMNALDQFDFAVMVLSPDDLLESRGMSYSSPRDNIIFELGLFMGRLGRSRTFIVNEQDSELKLPSDLAGITRSTYRRRDNLAAALSPTCTPIIRAIRSLRQAEARGLHRLGEATAQVENVSERLVRLVAETQESVQDTIAEVRRIPQELTAYVPREMSGRPLSWVNNVQWASFPVHKGNFLRVGPELRLSGGETIKYTMGFRSGRPPSQLADADVNGYLVVGEWRYALKDQGELQVFAASQSPGSPMVVQLEAPGHRREWDIAITVLSRPNAQ